MAQCKNAACPCVPGYPFTETDYLPSRWLCMFYSFCLCGELCGWLNAPRLVDWCMGVWDLCTGCYTRASCELSSRAPLRTFPKSYRAEDVVTAGDAIGTVAELGSEQLLGAAEPCSNACCFPVIIHNWSRRGGWDARARVLVCTGPALLLSRSW